jgi:hypothetical protein
MESSTPETVLEVGAEGGTLAIVRQPNERGTWDYWCLRDETTVLDVLPEDEIENRDDLFEEFAHVEKFEDALLRLDKYPWFRLFPMKVSAEFADLLLREVERRGGKEAAVEWTERLKRPPF